MACYVELLQAPPRLAELPRPSRHTWISSDDGRCLSLMVRHRSAEDHEIRPASMP